MYFEALLTEILKFLNGLSASCIVDSHTDVCQVLNTTMQILNISLNRKVRCLTIECLQGSFRDKCLYCKYRVLWAKVIIQVTSGYKTAML